MYIRTLALLGFAGLAAGGFATWALAQAASQPTAAPMAGQPDAAGRVTAPGQRAHTLSTAMAQSATACLQLYNGSGVFNFKLTVNPNTYPYPITGGTITGNICGSNWHATGGTLGSSLQLNGAINTPTAGCASTIGVVGTFAAPSGYNGTYGFNGSTTPFHHGVLFLGFNRPTCP